jgi:3-phosphoshikimate 1-carboxyvinyltransferase
VLTRFENNSLTLTKDINFKPETLNLELNNTSDIAQTICHLSWFRYWLPSYTSYFKIKETDRLEALRIELTKLGANISVTNDSLTLVNTINPNIKIATITTIEWKWFCSFGAKSAT